MTDAIVPVFGFFIRVWVYNDRFFEKFKKRDCKRKKSVI